MYRSVHCFFTVFTALGSDWGQSGHCGIASKSEMHICSFWGGKTKKLLSPSIKNRGPLLQAAKKPTPLLGRKHSRHNPWRECCNELVFVFRRTRIVPVGIRRLNPAVLPVDHHFRTLISADDSARLNGLVLRFKVATCTRASSAFYVPTAVCRRNNVVCLSCHFSVSFQLKIWIIERGETTDPPYLCQTLIL